MREHKTTNHPVYSISFIPVYSIPRQQVKAYKRMLKIDGMESHAHWSRPRNHGSDRTNTVLTHFKTGVCVSALLSTGVGFVLYTFLLYAKRSDGDYVRREELLRCYICQVARS